MNLRQIDAFRSVMECGSMTAAARALGISQPNVSRLIAQLEATTGLRLFERRAGRLLTTDDGNALHAEVERSHAGLRRVQQAAADIKAFKHGRLRIVTVPALGYGFLPRAIRAFRLDHPDVTISLQLRGSATVIQWAGAQQCDIAIASNIAELAGVDVEPFAIVDGVCALPPGHPLAATRIVRPRHLAGAHFVSLPLDDDVRGQIDRIFEARRIERLLSLETQYSATVCSLVAEGLGVSIVNPISLRDFAHRGLVVRRFEPRVTFRSYLLIPRHRPRSRLAEAFLATMRQVYREEEAYIRAAMGDRQRLAAPVR
ncbi:MAG: LysR family transcriptional regulator [Alphaproteobacteria bacterium]|nr:LysR family transcriptional regulator [Alphaproteobacteria bacterium]